jgi:hypothetical protein
MSSNLVNQFLGEKDGQQLRAEIYTAGSGYTINYFINGQFIKEEVIMGHSVHYVEDAANNWLAGIKTLNG